MKIEIDKKVFDGFHQKFMVGVIWCKGVDNSGNPADIYEMLRDVEELIRVNFTSITIKTHNLITAWQAAVAHFGEKAKHYQSNVERMLKSILDGEGIKSENKLVDLCNFISLKYLVPVGVNDSKKIAGNLSFTIASGKEKFHIDRKTVHPEAGELILRGSVEVLSRKLDYRQTPRALVSKSTKNAVVHIEAVPPVSEQKLANITEELAGLARIFCGGKVKRAVLSNKNPSVEFK